MDLINLKIESERLSLIPINMDYLEVIFSEFTDEITTFMFPKTPESIDDTKKFITESIKNIYSGEEIVLMILDKNSKEFFGIVGFHQIKSLTPEMGIWIKKSAHGKKYGQEACKLVKIWAESNINYNYIIYPVVKENIPSRKIPESFGGKIMKEYSKTMLSGKTYDMVDYWIYKNN